MSLRKLLVLSPFILIIGALIGYNQKYQSRLTFSDRYYNCISDKKSISLISNYGSASAIIFDDSFQKDNRVNLVSLLGKERNGIGPAAGAIDPSGNFGYVANFDSSTLSKVDMRNKTLIKNISLGSDALPYGVIVTPDNKYVITANSFADTIAWYSTDTLEHVNTVELPKASYPYTVDTSPNGKYIYSVNRFSDSFTVISQNNYQIMYTLDLGKDSKPTGLFVSPDGQYVYTTNRGNDTVSKINVVSGVIEHTYNFPKNTGVRWVSQYRNELMVSSQIDNKLYKINLIDNKLTDVKSYDSNQTSAIGMANSYGSNNDNYAVYLKSDTLYVNSKFGQQAAYSLPIGSKPYHITTRILDNNCPVANTKINKNSDSFNSATLTNAPPSSIPYCSVGDKFGAELSARKIYNPDKSIRYETSFYDSKVYKFVGETTDLFLEPVSVGIGTRPSDILLDKDEKYIYLVREGANSILKIDTSDLKIVSTFDLPQYTGPKKMYWTPDFGSVIIATKSLQGYVINLNTSVGTLYSPEAFISVDCPDTQVIISDSRVESPEYIINAEGITVQKSLTEKDELIQLPKIK